MKSEPPTPTGAPDDQCRQMQYELSSIRTASLLNFSGSHLLSDYFTIFVQTLVGARDVLGAMLLEVMKRGLAKGGLAIIQIIIIIIIITYFNNNNII